MNFIDEATKLSFILNQDDFTAHVSGSLNSLQYIFIPRSIKQGLHEYKVTRISKCAFKNCSHVTSVDFPEDSELEVIDDEAFSNSYNLNSMVIPDKVKKIGDNAFYECLELNQLIISNNSELVSIGNFAFAHNRRLNINFIPNHVKFIGESAFIECSLSESIISENSELVSYEKDVFNNTDKKTIYIPEKMSQLKDNWCNGLKYFKDIKVSPKNKFFKYIDDVLLVGKTDEKSDNYDILYFVNPRVKQIIIPSNIKYIKPNAFQFCAKLQTIEIPSDSQIKSFYKIFTTFTSNSNIFIPSQVSEFEEGWCYAITYKEINIIISPENKFFKCINDNLIVGKSNKDSDEYDSLYFVNSNASSVVIIPSFIKYIKPYAFLHCNSLDTIEFQQNSLLQTIESNVFARLDANYIVIPKSVKNICDFAFCNSKIHSLKFQEGSEIVSIGKSAFEGTCITTIDIPPSVKVIKEKAFYRCSQLESINFSEDSELTSISISAISNSHIKVFCIPPKLENLIYEDDSFLDELPNIIISPKNKNFKFINNEMLVGKSNKEIDQYDTLYLLSRNSKNIKIPSEIKIIIPNVIKNFKCIETIEFESGSQLTKIDECFFVSANIEHILIPKHVKHIYSSAFQQSKLKTIEFEKDSELVLIDKFAFYDNRNLTSISIPSSVQYINFRAFCFCDKLENVEFPEDSQLISIGEEAFSKTLIKKIVLPRHLKVIERGAFQNCFSLKSVTFSDNSELITIKSLAFGCTQIESFTIPDSVKNIEDGLFHGSEKLSEFNISENSELVSISLIFSQSNVKSLFIPPKVSYISNYMLIENKQMSIKLSPKNPYFKFIDNKFLVGKSNKESDDFDVLYLVIQSDEQIKIPSNIK